MGTIGRDTRVTWLGHAGVEIRTPGGRVVLVDPWFDHPGSPRRLADQAACDLLLVTHGHGDHFTDDAIALARRCSPTIACVHELALHLHAQLGEGADVIGMNAGGTAEAAGLRVTMVPATHSSGGLAERGAVRYLGEPMGFVVELENGFRVYHAGDTAVFGDMALIRELHRPDLALLPIGGRYTMDPAGAALAVELLGVAHVAPIHWGTFPILAGTPAELERAIAVRGLDRVVVHAWRPGETIA